MRQLKITNQITNRGADSLEKYLYEIGKLNLITAEEEVELARRIKTGDREALNKLTKANLRFVVSVAKQYQNQGLSLSDLINEGNLGLIKAAKRFDETKGFKFISYAVWWIRQSIMQALVEQSRLVRLPLNKVGSFNKYNKAILKLEQEFEREPTPEEVAEVLDLNKVEAREMSKGQNKYVSTDAPLGAGEDGTILDVLRDKETDDPDSDLISASLKKEIEEVLGVISEREAKIIIHYYGLDGGTPFTLEEIGTKFNLTRERVRQIKERALRRLRRASLSRSLRNYL